ncbi:MAG: hypothetical protein NC548_32385 [Lachnospiraceae bacterium]|nr:hypothetical protein [Lachnospiraceae bacterium]
MRGYLSSSIKQEGCKHSYLADLFAHFPSHDFYVEPFAGTAASKRKGESEYLAVNYKIQPGLFDL